MAKARKGKRHIIRPVKASQPVKVVKPKPAKPEAPKAPPVQEAPESMKKIPDWYGAQLLLASVIKRLEELRDRSHGYGTKARGTLADAYRLHNRMNSGERSKALFNAIFELD
jgi:hypothetical protein